MDFNQNVNPGSGMNTGVNVPPNAQMNMQPNMNQPMGQMNPYANPFMYGNVPVQTPVKEKGKISDTEFKFGTFVLGMVGVLFVLSSLVVFGIYFLDSFWQGLLLYLIGALICGVGAFFYVKKFEKMAVFFVGLGLCSLYVTTFINYYYLKSFSGLVAFIINMTLTAIFLALSVIKETTVMRIICIIGCFVTLIPIDGINSAWDVVLPTTVLIVVNCFCYFFPVQKATILTDFVEYIMSYIVLVAMYAHLDKGQYEVWPSYILFAIHVVAIYLIVKKHKDEGEYLAFGIVGNFFYLVALWGISEGQDWKLIAVLIMLFVFAGAVFLLRKSKWRTLPIYAGSVYSIFVIALDGNEFYTALSMLALFVIFRVCAMFFSEMHVPDYVVNVMVAIYVLFGTREGDAQFVGYITAILIVLSSFIVKYYLDLYLVTGIIFAAAFIETESFSVMIRASVICAYAVALIIGGFLTKKSVIRISGIILVILGAIELVADSLTDVSPMIKMITFFIAGVVILAISFVYMVIEKKNENKKDKTESVEGAANPLNQSVVGVEQQMPNQMAGMAPVGTAGQPINQMPNQALGQMPNQVPGQMPMYPGNMQMGAQMPMYPGNMQMGAQMPNMAPAGMPGQPMGQTPNQMPNMVPGQMPMYPGNMPMGQMPNQMSGQMPMYPGNMQMGAQMPNMAPAGMPGQPMGQTPNQMPNQVPGQMMS